MICLCCGKLLANPTQNEMESGWHSSCIKKFFQTNEMPEIAVSKDQIDELVLQSVNLGFTVPGVQKKLSLKLSGDKGGRQRLTLVNYPSGYILKPQSPDFAEIAEAEHLAMTMARTMKIPTVPFALVKIKNEFAYITKRVDRTPRGKLAMEDICQLSGRLTADKYKGSYEKCGKIIKTFSKNGPLDAAEFYYRVLFSFAIGNSDMHLKNFSLIESEPASRVFGISPAYDMLPVNIIMPEDKDEMALTVNGKTRNIRKKDFLLLAKSLGVAEKTALVLMKRIVDNKDKLFDCVESSFVSDEFKEQIKILIEERINVFK